MRAFATLGLLGAAALVAASDVHDLKQETFKGFVEENDIVLAECRYKEASTLECGTNLS